MNFSFPYIKIFAQALRLVVSISGRLSNVLLKVLHAWGRRERRAIHQRDTIGRQNREDRLGHGLHRGAPVRQGADRRSGEIWGGVDQ